MNSAGLTKEEMLELAKKLGSDLINVAIEDKSQFYELSLEWAQRLSPVVKSQHSIDKFAYDGLKNEQFEKVVADRQRKAIEHDVKQFGIELIDSMIVKLDLSDHYKNQYVDTNLIYKVKKQFTEQYGNLSYARDIFLYYLDSFKTTVPTYQALWSLITQKRTMHENEEEMGEIMHAISERFRQVLFAFDTMKDIISSGKTDNDVYFVFNFHLWHFISLIKSIGDNLAWMVNLHLKWQLDPLQIDLLNNHFRDSLTINHRHFAALIYEDPLFQQFTILKPYRDRIQHGHVIHLIEVMLGYPPTQTKLMLPKNPSSFVRGKLAKTNAVPSIRINAVVENNSEEYLGDNESAIHFGGTALENDFYDPITFCQSQIESVSSLCSNVLGRIELELCRKAIGVVIHYFNRKKVAVVNLNGSVDVGDSIMIEGATSSFTQKLESMEIEGKKVGSASTCMVGFEITNVARINDIVYKISCKSPKENDKTG